MFSVKKNKTALNNEAGFTILEVLIASVILAVALIGMAGMLTTNLKSVERGKNQTVATNLAIEMIEDLKMTATADFTDPALDDAVAGSDPATRTNPDDPLDPAIPVPVPGFPLFFREIYITDGAAPVNSKDIGVIVFWTDISGIHSVLMRTTIAR